VSKFSIRRFLRTNRWHSYQLHIIQVLSEDDPDGRMEFSEWALRSDEENRGFKTDVLYSDEADFCVSGEFNW
jgi:hypothetical protein